MGSTYLSLHAAVVLGVLTQGQYANNLQALRAGGHSYKAQIDPTALIRSLAGYRV
jgi:hypothetical protein